MEYKLYTLVDITHTGQYRAEHGKEQLRWKEQNFQTVLQVLNIRANISFATPPTIVELKGSLVGFPTDDTIRVWRFDFETERDFLFEKDGDQIGYLKDDFHLVPYISGLDELLSQEFAVFNSKEKNPNIVFHFKQ